MPNADKTLAGSPWTRRGVILASGAAGLAAAMVAGRWFNLGADLGSNALSVEDAHAAAVSGRILLVDIRRPDEWQRTGIGEGARPLDMRRPDFTDALQALTGGEASRSVALICARGVRSRHLADRLTGAGFATVLDVPEGMLGSGAGPGWLRKGLPVRHL